MKTGEEQYLDLCRRILDDGVMVENKRTGKTCLTVINADFEYDASQGKLPVITTRKVPWRAAIAEMLGYLRGYDNASDFAKIGCNTWIANANENPDWLKNPHRKGPGDIGRAYGVQLRDWRNPENVPIDQLRNVCNKLSKGIDDRRLIMTFHNPGETDRAALDACMHTHHFSILDGVLHLTSYQRSADVPLGLAFNMIQTVFLLRVMSKITKLKPGKVYHKLVNCHIYEDQINLMREQLTREPFGEPTLHIEVSIESLRELGHSRVDPQYNNCFYLAEYKSHPPIKYPFSV